MVKKVGRPKAGRGPKGEAVSVAEDYQQTTLRLPHEAKAELDAVAMVENRSRSSVIEEAVGGYVGALPADARRAVEAVKASKLSALSTTKNYRRKSGKS